MQHTTLFSADGAIYAQQGRLDPWDWSWVGTDLPNGAEKVTALEAIRILSSASGSRKVPVGVIGPREATEEQLSIAEGVGQRIGKLGLSMICGGKSGVMEAASKGCYEAGGLTIGMIPDHTWRTANKYIQLPIATGLSEARNMIIAKSCEVLIAVGGSYGTLSEIAYGLHFSKPVITLAGAAYIEGVDPANSAEDAIEKTASYLITRMPSS